MFWGKKSIEDKIKDKVKSTLSKKVAALINDNIEKRVEFSSDEKIPAHAGDSKAGGIPHFIDSSSIPYYEGRPLKLIAQINCKDLVSLERFPHEGMLYIFLDIVDSPESFPEKPGQFKVLYFPEAHSVESTTEAEQGAYKLKAVETYSIHENQSYIFDGVEVPEDDIYNIIDLQFGAIADIVGDYGSVKVGGVPDLKALWGWAYQHLGYVDSFGAVDWTKIEKSGKEAQHNAEQILKDFELVYTEILDSYGHTDSWIFIGIHKDDLKKRNFENVYASFDAT